MAGRPTYWSEDVEAQAFAYINDFEKYGHAFPSVVGLCSVLNRSRATIYRWATEEGKQFRDILDAINENQELVAFNRSITGEYNATIAKLLLGKHGYHDKVDQDVSSTDGSMATVSAKDVAEAIKIMVDGDNV